MQAVSAASSSGTFRCRLCVARGCPTKAHARRSETGANGRAERTPACGKGLVFSLEGLDQLVERQLRHRLLQTIVLAFEFLQTLRLVELQAAVLAPPAIVALLETPMLRLRTRQATPRAWQRSAHRRPIFGQTRSDQESVTECRRCRSGRPPYRPLRRSRFALQAAVVGEIDHMSQTMSSSAGNA